MPAMPRIGRRFFASQNDIDPFDPAKHAMSHLSTVPKAGVQAPLHLGFRVRGNDDHPLLDDDNFRTVSFAGLTVG